MHGDYLRGHAIHRDVAGIWRYSDNNDPTVGNVRPCGHCQLPNTAEDHDGCLGTLPGVVNACCGHGIAQDAYVQLRSGVIIAGHAAVALQKTIRILAPGRACDGVLAAYLIELETRQKYCGPVTQHDVDEMRQRVNAVGDR